MATLEFAEGRDCIGTEQRREICSLPRPGRNKRRSHRSKEGRGELSFTQKRRAMSVLKVYGIEWFFESKVDGEPLLLLHGMTGSHEDWEYAGRQEFLCKYRLITHDARGHGRSTNPEKTITHRQCAHDTLALLDHLGIQRCRAIGVSMDGNILLHMATLQSERIEAMVVVSATMYFPEQARAIMLAFPVEDQPESKWETMRRRHKHGDAQIVALWEQCLALKDSWSEKLTALARQGTGRGTRLSQGARVTYLGVTTPTLSTPLQAM
jgi:pimeloyl-ACP methyl ester carboxylesterase